MIWLSRTESKESRVLARDDISLVKISAIFRNFTVALQVFRRISRWKVLWV
jgi:hypothetical protein